MDKFEYQKKIPEFLRGSSTISTFASSAILRTSDGSTPVPAPMIPILFILYAYYDSIQHIVHHKIPSRNFV